MKIKELKSEIEEVKKDLKIRDGVVDVTVDGYAFDISHVTDSSDGVSIETEGKFPCYLYRFTFAMFDPKTDKFRGITHRMYRGVSDSEIIEERLDYVPGWEDIKYELLRIERVLDDSADIYKQVWEVR